MNNNMGFVYNIPKFKIKEFESMQVEYNNIKYQPIMKPIVFQDNVCNLCGLTDKRLHANKKCSKHSYHTSCWTKSVVKLFGTNFFIINQCPLCNILKKSKYCHILNAQPAHTSTEMNIQFIQGLYTKPFTQTHIIVSQNENMYIIDSKFNQFKMSEFQGNAPIFGITCQRHGKESYNYFYDCTNDLYSNDSEDVNYDCTYKYLNGSMLYQCK